MEDLLALRAGLDSLSNREFIDWIQSYDKVFITNIMFGFFHYQLQQIENIKQSDGILSNIKNVKESIFNIIRSRKAKKKSNTLCQMELVEAIKLDKLPNRMIAEISSYLDLECILNLEKCNRNIFIGTRSPISVYKLDANKFSKCWSFSNNPSTNYQLHHWLRFKSLTHLTISVDSFFHEFEEECIFKDCKYELKHVLMSKKLETLTLINSDLDFDIDCVDEYDQNKLIDNLAKCDLSNIKTIRFENGTFELDEQMRIKLGLASCSINIKCESNKDLNTAKHANDIGNGKETLHLDEETVLNVNEKYNNLKEICLSSVSQLEIGRLNQQNLKYLQRINCDFTGFSYNGFKDKFCPSIGLLFRRDSVNYISIKSSVVKEEFQSLINVLNESLKHMLPRKKMKIRICASNMYMGMDDDISDNLLMILNSLDANTDDFMLIGDISITPKYKNAITQLLDEHNTKYQILAERVMKLGVYFHKFVVTNKNCIINGYKENWITNCYQCDTDALFD